MEGLILLSRLLWLVCPPLCPCPLWPGGCYRLLCCLRPCRPLRGPGPGGEQGASSGRLSSPEDGAAWPALLAACTRCAQRPGTGLAVSVRCGSVRCRLFLLRPPPLLPPLPAALSWPWQPPPLDSLATTLGLSLC